MTAVLQRSAKTLYIDGELPLSLLQKRLQQLGQPSPNLTVLSRDVLLRRGITLPDLAEAEGRDFTDAIVEALGIEVIILDSLSTLIRSGVENEAESWTPIQDWLLSHRFHGRTIIIIHHEGRSKKPRGTSKREDIMDTIVRLNELEPDDSQPRENQSTFEISFTKTREFYGSAKAALIVKQSTASGVAQWSYEFARDHLHQRVDELKRQGLTQKDIARQLGVSQPQVSRILTDLSVRRRGSAQAEETTEADVEILDRPR